ncbi:hypothetical protein PSV08DRAFT_255011 [Bipolaris maydis]|uniref:uncharacterized protein n=1 Tax=Cochliobolus heterostrophus TaxID=5016 RepID=UPI0024D4AB17|nr:hypothetical protein PSV08DRAFT_255011 [Bipolaris maydis]KAJ6286764.1 hypothetical protein J3E71DRAFT_247649 [Bipolaris maydis]
MRPKTLVEASKRATHVALILPSFYNAYETSQSYCTVRLPSRGSSFCVGVFVLEVPNGWFGGIGRNRMMQSRKRLSVQGLPGKC